MEKKLFINLIPGGCVFINYFFLTNILLIIKNVRGITSGYKGYIFYHHFLTEEFVITQSYFSVSFNVTDILIPIKGAIIV